jgi:hypothetical protein
MAHYAFIDDENIVTEVIFGMDESEEIEGFTPEEWYGNFKGLKCIKTSFNGKIRFNFAGVGFSYDPIDDAFIAPMPDCGHAELKLNSLKRWECANAEHTTGQDIGK